MHRPLALGRFMTHEAQGNLARTVSRASRMPISDTTFRVLNKNKSEVRLVTTRGYKQALRQPVGSLRDLEEDEIKGVLEENIRQNPTEAQWLPAETGEAFYRSVGRIIIISYPLKVPEVLEEHQVPAMQKEHQRLTGLIDDLNGVNTRWRPFSPLLSVAMLPGEDNRAATLTAAFERARPPIVALTPVLVHHAPESLF